MTLRPTVSVCMATYNHAAFIEKAIASVLAQTVDFKIELVIGEDCSTDATRQIVTDYAARRPDVIRPLLRTENMGAGANVQDVYLQSRGDYICILDGDDYWTDPTKLQRQVAFMEANPSMAFSYHVVDVQTDSGESVRRQPAVGSRPVQGIEDLLRRRGLGIQTCSVMFNRRLVGEHPDWIADAPQGDWPLYVMSATRGSIGFLDRMMAVYRLHDGGVWSSVDWPKRLRRAIANERLIREHIPARYHSLMDRRIAWTHADLSIALAVEGEREEARRSARACLSEFPTLAATNPLRVAKMLAFAYAPRSISAAKRAMRLAGLQRHRSGAHA